MFGNHFWLNLVIEYKRHSETYCISNVEALEIQKFIAGPVFIVVYCEQFKCFLWCTCKTKQTQP